MRRAVSGTQHGYGGTNVPEEEGEKERKEERKRGRRRVTSVLVCSTAAPHTHKTPHMCTTSRFARTYLKVRITNIVSMSLSFLTPRSHARTHTHHITQPDAKVGSLSALLSISYERPSGQC